MTVGNLQAGVGEDSSCSSLYGRLRLYNSTEGKNELLIQTQIDEVLCIRTRQPLGGTRRRRRADRHCAAVLRRRQGSGGAKRLAGRNRRDRAIPAGEVAERSYRDHLSVSG